MKYWIVFYKGQTHKGEVIVFPGPYIGKEILWQYLIDDVKEEMNFFKLMVLGYQEVNHKTLKKIFPDL